MNADISLIKIYRTLLNFHGRQGWWPAESPFEVIVGAVLTQNTSWGNVEKSISALKKEGLLDIKTLLKAKQEKVKTCIRSSGYYNIKYERLTALLKLLVQDGVEEKLQTEPVETARKILLEVKGIGRETADSILLYAFERPVFVIDAYTKRMFSRLAFPEFSSLDYDAIRVFFETNLPKDVNLWNEYHALIVKNAKVFCKPHPDCSECPLKLLCEYFISERIG